MAHDPVINVKRGVISYARGTKAQGKDPRREPMYTAQHYKAKFP